MGVTENREAMRSLLLSGVCRSAAVDFAVFVDSVNFSMSALSSRILLLFAMK